MAFWYFTAGIDVNAIPTAFLTDFTATGLYNAGFRRKPRAGPSTAS
jgi:hypothetical protein